MIEAPPSRGILLAGILGVALAGCGGGSNGPGGSGGAAGTSGPGGAGAGGSALGAKGGDTGSGPGSGGSSGGASGGSTGGASGGSTGAAGEASPAGSGGAGRGGGGAGRGGADAAGGSGPGGAGGGASAGSSGSTAGRGGNGGASSGAAGSAGRGAAGTGGGSAAKCTASKPTGTSATGSGPHKVIAETNSDPGINEGTIFRPADLGGTEKYPIFVWGEGGCSKDGLSNAVAMAEIASHGYFVIADGTPNGSGNRAQDRSMLNAMAAPLIAYVDWAIAENDKPCSAYYQSLEPTKVSANGFSCGGLMSQAMVLDPRIVTWGVNSSGMKGATQSYYDLIKTPVLFVEGGPDDIAYDGGLEGYTAISKLNVPVLWFSKPLGHGGDLFGARGGDFTKINIAWLNWWLKGDETATGKGLLVGTSCPYCRDSAWEYKSAHVP